MQLNVDMNRFARETAQGPMPPEQVATLAAPAPSAIEVLWELAVAHTREKSPASFDQWFAGVQFDDLTDGVLSLRARDEFVRQWVDDYFVPTLADQLREHTSLSIQVRWTVGGVLDRPVASPAVSFTPVGPRPLTLRAPIPDSARA